MRKTVALVLFAVILVFATRGASAQPFASYVATIDVSPLSMANYSVAPPRQDGEFAPVITDTGNLLRNPSFEGTFAVQDGKGTIIMAPEWGGYWKDGGSLPDWAQGGASQGPIRQPEYKASTLSVDPRRVRTGASAQCLFTFYGVMLGGVQQTVDVTKGASYQAGFFAQAWTDNSDDPCTTKGQMIATVGIDPYGGSDPWARRVIWADWQDANPGCNKWLEIKSPVAVAQNARITVFHLWQHRWSFKHGDAYEEDAWLRELASATAPCPIQTPCPLATLVPSPTPGGCPSLNDIEALLRRLQFGVR